MVTLACDGALRREELVQLDVEDFEPAHCLIHLRAETTKSQRAREVAFGTTSSQLFVAYLRERRKLFGRIGGPLFRSTSNRNCGAPLGASSWSKTVESIARRAGADRLSTHTFRHLRLTDLARADWAIDQIAQYAGPGLADLVLEGAEECRLVIDARDLDMPGQHVGEDAPNSPSCASSWGGVIRCPVRRRRTPGGRPARPSAMGTGFSVATSRSWRIRR
jgi:hypothetical protein